MSAVVRIATRRSRLALWQAEHVAELLRAAQPSLKVELVPHAQGQQETLEALLKDRLRLRTNLRYDLEFHEYGTLPRYPVKAKRFKDLR